MSMSKKSSDLDSPYNQDVVMHVGIKMYHGVNLDQEAPKGCFQSVALIITELKSHMTS